MHAEFLFREHMLDTHAIMSQCVHMYVEDHTTYMAIYTLHKLWGITQWVHLLRFTEKLDFLSVVKTKKSSSLAVITLAHSARIQTLQPIASHISLSLCSHSHSGLH